MNIDRGMDDGGWMAIGKLCIQLMICWRVNDELKALVSCDGTEIAHPRCQDTQMFQHADLPSIKALETRRHIHERGE